MEIADFTAVNDQTFGDWQKDYLYKVVIGTEPTGLALLPLSVRGDLNKDAIDAFLDSFPVPQSKVSSQRRRWAGQWWMFSGKLETQNTVQVTCRFDTGNRLYKYLHAWHELSGSNGTAAQLPKGQYVGKIQLIMYKGDKETPSPTSFELVNAWIPELSDFNLDKTKDSILTFTATIAFDKRLTTTP